MALGALGVCLVVRACCLIWQGGQSGESRREWATAVLEALRSQNKLPGLPGPGQSGQAEANGQQQPPGQAGSGEPHLASPSHLPQGAMLLLLHAARHCQ